MKKVHGSIYPTQNSVGTLQFYRAFCKSPFAYTSPDPNPPEGEWEGRNVNILVTGKLIDQSQKNFEMIVQAIGLRIMPAIINEPLAVADLSLEGSLLSGEGFVWDFAVDREDIFTAKDSSVGLLNSDMDGIILSSGVVLKTSGPQHNIEFKEINKL